MLTNSKKKTIFITGATGLLGSYLLKILLENNYKIYVLTRAKNNQSPQERIVDVLKFWQVKYNKKDYSNLIIIEGDITLPNFGIKSKDTIKLIRSEIEIIIHSAALTTFRAPLSIIRNINITGTKNVLDFAFSCKKLEKMNHISTVYVVGNKSIPNFSEDMLELGQGFNNTYEQTKYEAEILVKDYIKKGLFISIFRPSIIMGDSIDGKTNNFHLAYEPLHYFYRKIYREYPINLATAMNLINVDSVAKAIFLLLKHEHPETYHIVSPNSINQDFFQKLSSRYFNFKMPKFIPVEKFDFNKLTPVQKMLAMPFMPYCNYKTNFLFKKTQDILNRYNFKCPVMDREKLEKIFEYCDKTGFIKIQK